jgi:cytoskeletal protein RodZ
MAFHYIRKFGKEGALQRIDGLQSGLTLNKLRHNSTLPLRVSIEILAFIADALNDALKNGFVHGDLKMENICITPEASVVINGYGRPRRNTFAPEGIPEFSSDIYGLGIIMLELLANKRGLQLPLEESLHNRLVIETFTQIDWQEWSEQPWLSNMQEFLISLLFFTKESRPHPLDIANILTNSIPTTVGVSIKEFLTQNSFSFPTKESLAQPTILSGTAISAVELVADSTQGMATGFWTKDKIAEMFHDNIVDDFALQEDWKPPQQKASHSAIDQQLVPLKTASKNQHNPNNRLTPLGGSSNEKVQRPPSLDQFTPQFPTKPFEHSQPPQNHAPTLQQSYSQPPVQNNPRITAGKQPQPTIPIAKNTVPVEKHHINILHEKPTTPTPLRKEQEPVHKIQGPNNKQLIFLGIGIAVLGILMGVGSIVLLQMFNSPSQEPVEVYDDVEFEDEPEPSLEPQKVIEPSSKQKNKNKNKKRSRSKKRSKEKKETKQTPKTKQQKIDPPVNNTQKNEEQQTETEKENIAQTPSGPFQLQVKFRGQEAKISCGDGQQAEFVDVIMLTFSNQYYCRVENNDGLKGLVHARKAGVVNCKVKEDKISCR